MALVWPLPERLADATMQTVTAEEIIALETAMRDLARLYESALVFASLRSRAENELLPRMTEVGGGIRERLRTQSFDAGALKSAASELHGLTELWQSELARTQDDPRFIEAAAAFARDDQSALRVRLRQLFAGLTIVDVTPPRLHYAPSLAAPRRRPGARPFLSALDAAERIAACRTGIEPVSGETWWDAALRYVPLAEDAAMLESPVTLALDLRSTSYALFAMDGDPTLRVYTPNLAAPFRVAIAKEPNDDWWEAASEPYATFRDQLVALLVKRGIAVDVSE